MSCNKCDSPCARDVSSSPLRTWSAVPLLECTRAEALYTAIHIQMTPEGRSHRARKLAAEGATILDKNVDRRCRQLNAVVCVREDPDLGATVLE